jgi:hypothetical protein
MQKISDPQAYLQKFHLQDKNHASWNRSFDAQMRCAQIDEDLFAARSVSGVLIAIVTFGALLGVLGTLLAIYFG